MSRNRLSVTILCGALVALASFGCFSRYCTDALFTSDSADYVRGAKIGLAASYFDTHSVGLWGSLKIMQQHPEARLHLWDILEQQDDAAPNRHFHVAPALYGNAMASQFGASTRTHRLIMAAVGAIAIGTLFVGLQLAGVHFLLALATAALATLTPAVVCTSSTVSPHAPFLAALIACGFAFAQYLEKGDRAWGIVTGVTLGLAVATCELSIVIFVAFGVILLWRAFRFGIRASIRGWQWPVGTLFATLLLVWPGGVLRGGYALSYGTFCLQALFRRTNYFGEASPTVILTRGAQGSSLVILLFVAIAIGVLILEWTRKSNLHIQIFSWLVFGFFAQGMLNRFRNQTYVAHFVVVTWILLALLCQQWLVLAKGGRARYRVLAAVCGVYSLLAIPASGWPLASDHGVAEERAHVARAEEVLTLANSVIPPGATILGNSDYEIWGLYLPQNIVKHSTSALNLQPRPWINMPEDYWIIADPLWLSSDWRGRLPALTPANSAGGFVVAHICASKE